MASTHVLRLLSAAVLLGGAALAAKPISIAKVERAPKAAANRIQAAAGTLPACMGSSGTIQCTDLRVQYYGGHVLANPKVYAVLWTGAVNATIKSNIGAFYTAVTNSPMLDWMNEYNTNIDIQAGASIGGTGTNQLVGRGTFAGTYTITPTVNTGKQLSDGDLTSELDAQINSHKLPPPDANSIYMLHFPTGYAIVRDAKASSCLQFCAYHGTYSRSGKSVFYGVMPDFGGPDVLGHDCSSGGCGGGSIFNNTTAASSHELFEAVTDAEVGLVTADDAPLGWYDSETSSQGEIGDMCNQDADTIVGFDGQSYTVQQEYSQKMKLCQTSYFRAQDFALALNPNVTTVQPGGDASVIPLTTTATAGGAQSLALEVDSSIALPTGITATLSQSTLTSDNGAATVTITASGAVGTFKDAVLVVKATGAGGVVHTASVLLQLGPLAKVTAPAASATVSGLVSITATGTPQAGGTLSHLALQIDGKEVATGTSATASFSWDTTLIVNGHHTITAIATDADGASSTAVDTVTVTNDFALSLPADNATATIGGSPANYLLTTTSTGSGAPAITLVASGLPVGVIAAFVPATVAAGGTAMLTLTAPAGTLQAKATTFTVTGTTPGVPAGHDATGSVDVRPPGGCSSLGRSGGELLGLLALLSVATVARRRRSAG